MKMRIASTVLLCLLFAAFAFASPRPQDEPKSKEASPAMERQDKPEAKPETREQKPDEMKSEKNEQEKQENNKDAKEQEKENKDRDKQEQKEEKKSDKNKEMGNMRDEDNGNARSAGKGGHIPDDKFRSSFGRSHTFHPSRPTIVNNQPTFVYGGYSFIMVDPWPVGWAYSDDCYIDYVDGEYFLFDVLHPGVRIALFVSM